MEASGALGSLRDLVFLAEHPGWQLPRCLCFWGSLLSLECSRSIPHVSMRMKSTVAADTGLTWPEAG